MERTYSVDWPPNGDNWYIKYESMSHQRRAWLTDNILSYPSQSIMEVGCCGGSNLQCIYKHPKYNQQKLYGVELHKLAYQYACKTKPYIIMQNKDVTKEDIPIVDLIFTSCVLQHIHDKDIISVCKKLYVSAPTLLLLEYYADKYFRYEKSTYKADYNYTKIFKNFDKNINIEVKEMPKFTDGSNRPRMKLVIITK